MPDSPFRSHVDPFVPQDGPQQDEAILSPIPLLSPSPSRLSQLGHELAKIESSRFYSNFGPVNNQFERAVVAKLFDGVGGVITACNATIALMVAIKHATLRLPPARRYALMPAFGFAATAHAALWCGLTPLLSDITPDTWLADPAHEEALLAGYADEVAVIVACTTLGNPVDLSRYRALAAKHRCALVVDAAASLGTNVAATQQFGLGSSDPIVFSLHATKAFATHEGGLIYVDDPDRLAALRAMTNFGFTEPRCATLPGLNAKLSEVGALIGLEKLSAFDAVVSHRHAIDLAYRAALPECAFQRMVCARYAPIFSSMLLPRALVPTRGRIRDQLRARGIHTGTYFDPHLGGQPYLQQTCVIPELPVADDVSARVLTLPMSDMLTEADVRVVASELRRACERPSRTVASRPQAC